MSLIPSEAVKIEVENSTVDFYEYKKNGTIYYYFDTSLCGPPEPMINAMAGLALIDSENKKLIMINHSLPGALFPRIAHNFEYDIKELKGGGISVEFSYIKNGSENADLSQTDCSGC